MKFNKFLTFVSTITLVACGSKVTPTEFLSVTATLLPTATRDIRSYSQSLAFRNVADGNFFILDENTSYAIDAEPIEDVDGYRWMILRGDTVLWDSYGSNNHLTQSTINFSRLGLPIMDKVVPGEPLELHLLTSIDGQWIGPVSATIYFFNNNAEYQTWLAENVSRFVYPMEGQELYPPNGYSFKIEPISGVEEYLWGFFQNNVLIWENLRDAGTLDGNEYIISTTHPAYALIQPGELEVVVRGMVDNNWTNSVVQVRVTVLAQDANCAAGWSRLAWDDDAIVTPGGQPNRVRSAPNTDPDNVLTTIYSGTVVHIVEGPWCNNGLIFWKVESDSIPGGSGWTAEGDLTEYWLAPYEP